jgi:hypothetical protein
MLPTPSRRLPLCGETEEEGGQTTMSAGPRVGAGSKTLARVIVAGSAVLLLVATACGREPSAQSPSPIPDTVSATPSPGVTSSGLPPSDGPRFPNLRRFTDPFDRFAYKTAYSDCRLRGVDRTAEGFGGDPQDPPSVARAYAVAVFAESVEHREATFQGCIDGFMAATG